MIDKNKKKKTGLFRQKDRQYTYSMILSLEQKFFFAIIVKICNKDSFFKSVIYLFSSS